MVNYEFPPIGGGGGTTTKFLAKYLSRLGVDVNILTSQSGKENFYHHPEGFKLHYIGPEKNKLSTTHIPELVRFIITSIFHAKNIIKTVQPDLVHCFFALPSGCFGLYCNKIYNIPFITSVLGADVPGFNIGDWRLNAYHFLTRNITRSIWENSSYLVANSSSLKALCNNFAPKKNIEVITNGVDTDIFYPETKKEITDEVQLLFISRLMWQKGIETLITACGLLKTKRITNYKLTIVGDGYLRNTMFALVDRYKIKDRINFLGWRSLEELPEFYRSSDVFILPSTMEGMPSVVLQAMASGLSIIATKVQGFEEILENNVNGITVKYNNPEELASAIERLIKSPDLRQQMSKKSIEKSKQFSWDSIGKQYLELYKKSIISF